MNAKKVLSDTNKNNLAPMPYNMSNGAKLIDFCISMDK